MIGKAWLIIVVLATFAGFVIGAVIPEHKMTWALLDESLKPATIEDCMRAGYPNTRITINTNVGAYSTWRRFCYWGK